MLLRIMRKGNQYDYVKNTMLERLIKADGLLKFKRRTGWVNVGTDPTRNSMNDSVENNNRRRESDESSPAGSQRNPGMVDERHPEKKP